MKQYILRYGNDENTLRYGNFGYEVHRRIGDGERVREQVRGGKGEGQGRRGRRRKRIEAE